jgi:hypothetical protein
VVRIGALFAHFVPDLITNVSCGSGIGRRVRLWQLVHWLPRPAGEQERGTIRRSDRSGGR